jgi:hypothetical protein
MPEPPSYALRVSAKARSETARFTKHKLLTGACVAITALIVRLALWHFRQITTTWAEILIGLLIVVSSFVVVALGSLIVNLFRAPALLDQERAAEIGTLTTERDRIKLERHQEETAIERNRMFAGLMNDGQEVWNQFAGAREPEDFDKIHIPFAAWISRTVAALYAYNLHTDAVAFSQAGNSNPSTELIASFAVYGWKPSAQMKLRLACDKAPL